MTLPYRPSRLFRRLAAGTALPLIAALAVTQAAPLQAQERLAFDLGTLVLQGSKRDETIADYAGAVNVETSEELAQKRIDDGFGIMTQTIGVDLLSYADRSNSVTKIRGVGPLLQPLAPDDSSVLTFVDGAPLMLEQSTSSYLDVEQVEVFKGPQNTLFGRSTSGGAINLVPNTPTDELEGRVTLEYGTDNDYKAEIVANVPIVPGVLSSRFALRQTGADGYVDNHAGKDLGGEEIAAGRASLLWTPTSDTSVLLSYFHEDVALSPNYYTTQIGDGSVADAYQSYSDDDQTTHLTTLKVEHDFGPLRFTSQTSYNTIDIDTAYQGDHDLFGTSFGMDPSLFDDDETNRLAYDKTQSRLTQEFRLSSAEGARVSWVAGITGFRDEYDIVSDQHVSVYQGYSSGITDFHQTNEGVAVFGDATVPLTDRLSLSGGLRYTRETKEFDATYDANGLDALYAGVVPAFEESGRETYEYWSGKAALSYDWSDTATTWASVSRGVKSGGFGTYNSFMAYGVPRSQYESAETTSYEIGGRLSLAGGALDLSGSIFHIDMRNEQIMLFDFATFGISNANVDARSRGVELNADWYPGSDWTLSAGLAWTDTEITSVPTDAAALNPGLEAGDDLPNTPKWAGNFSAEYRTDAGRFGWTGAGAPQELSARLSYSYMGDRFFDAANLGKIEATHLVSGRIGISWERSELYLFGENLLDEEYFLTRQPFGAHPTTGETVFGVSQARGRTFGIGYTMTF